MIHAGVIAAGDGTRLKARHPETPKPLVPVAGAPLCHWVIDALRQAGARRVTMLVNSRGAPVRESLERTFPDVAWRFLQQDTASSWESFRLVCRAVAEEAPSFLVSTIDALVPPAEVSRFAREAAAAGAPSALALTDFIDDEKPLWADLEPSGRISAVGGAAVRRLYATAGLYYMTRAAAAALPPAPAFASLRGYWEAAAAGGSVAGVVLSKTVDVDRPEDVEAAEGFLKEAIGSW